MCRNRTTDDINFIMPVPRVRVVERSFARINNTMGLSVPMGERSIPDSNLLVF